MLNLGLWPLLYVVRGSSMEPSLLNGDVLLVTRWRRQLRRGDIVIVDSPDGTDIGWQVKRVVGLPGDVVSFECGLMYVNGDHHPESYLAGLPADVGLESRAWQTGSDEFIALGDNRAHSTDSRHYGPIALNRVVGIALLRAWPLGGGRPRRVG